MTSLNIDDWDRFCTLLKFIDWNGEVRHSGCGCVKTIFGNFFNIILTYYIYIRPKFSSFGLEIYSPNWWSGSWSFAGHKSNSNSPFHFMFRSGKNDARQVQTTIFGKIQLYIELEIYFWSSEFAGTGTRLFRGVRGTGDWLDHWFQW